MISKLPKWVWFGTGALAFIAGMINSIGFLGFENQGITHLTGSTTLLGIAVAQGDTLRITHFLAIIGAFLSGCIVSGALIQDSTLKLGRRYGVALALESLLLFCAVPLLQRSETFGVYLASCACGLQNGMVSTYSGAVLRTSHVSGAFTDLGISLGQFVRGLPLNRPRVRLCAILIAGFLLGGIAGAIGHASFGYQTLYAPAAITGIVGIVYGIYQHRRIAKA